MASGHIDATILANIDGNTQNQTVLDPVKIKAFYDEVASKNDGNYDFFLADYNAAIGLSRQAMINGNFDVWQRGTSFLNAANYTADRFTVANSIDSNVKVLQSTSVPNSQSQYSARIEGYGAVGGAGAFSDFIQYVEDYKYLAGQKVTISGWVKCDAGASAAPHILDGITDSAAPTITATTWTYFKYTATVNAVPTSLRFYLRFFRSGLAVGVGVNFAQLMLNVGDQALPFQPRSFADELALCQRYYEKSYDTGIAPQTVSTNGAVAFGVNYGAVQSVSAVFKTRKRTAPTIYTYSPFSTNVGGTGTSARYYVYSTGDLTDGTIDQVGESGFRLQTPNVSAQSRTFHFTADAEL